MRGFLFSLGAVTSAVTVFVAVPELAMAEASPVTLTELVSFSSVVQTLSGTIGPIVASAIGLGLGIWAARFLFRLVKSMAR